MDNQGNNITSPELLRSIVERIERLEDEKRGLVADISEIYMEAKSKGFDTKIIRLIIKEKQLSEWERSERDALLDIYKAALGMLDGTPLGKAAVDRLEKKKEPATEDSAEQIDPSPQETEITEQAIQDARSIGANAALAGKPVTTNPFPARSPLRSAFDEGWCQAAGNDGMDIPDAWKPAKKASKKKDDKESEDK